MAKLEWPTLRGGIINAEVEDPLQSIFEESATQKYKVGTRLVAGDSEFFYALNGAVALVAGYMTQAEAPMAAVLEEVQTAYAKAAGAVDITCLMTTGTTLTENELAEGYLFANKVNRLCDMQKIAASKQRSTDTLLDLKLYQPLEAALAADTELSIVKNPCMDVIVAPTTQTAQVVGVPRAAITAAYYGWLQIKGPCPVIVDDGETVVIGQNVGRPSTAADPGACGVAGTQVAGEVYGKCMAVGATDEPALVYLNLGY